jgi:hypothetical protein
LLCADLTGACDKCDCCERKNRSIESRFHRVTPYAAMRLRLLFWTFRETNFLASHCGLCDHNRMLTNFFRGWQPKT